MLFWVLFGIVFIAIFFRQNQKEGILNLLRNTIYMTVFMMVAFMFKVPFYNFKTGSYAESEDYAAAVFGCLVLLFLISAVYVILALIAPLAKSLSQSKDRKD